MSVTDISAGVSFTDAAIGPGRTHTTPTLHPHYAVRAFDAEGNTGPEGSPLSVTVPSSCGFGPDLLLILPALLWLQHGVAMRGRPS